MNFLSPDLHECSWYKNYTRQNFPSGGKYIGIVSSELFWHSCLVRIAYAGSIISRSLYTDFDPVGVICSGKLDGIVLLDDEEFPVSFMTVNIRIANDLNRHYLQRLGTWSIVGA